MNKENNVYIIVFSVIMVVVVGVSLAFVAQFTKPFQDANIRLEKMQNILSSVGIIVDRTTAEETYNKYITKSEVYKVDGSLQEGVDAFGIDLANELKKPEDQQLFPIYECKKEDGNYFILPMRGKGLWGPIWGYVSLKDDGITVAGAVFDHSGETPGLGAEISKTPFQEQFINKEIVDESGQFVSITVAKPGKLPEGYEYGVDGISGGTLTSVGVHNMLHRYLQAFRNYVEKNNILSPVTPTTNMTNDTLQLDSTTVITEQ